jgi:hypothetical protein
MARPNNDGGVRPTDPGPRWNYTQRQQERQRVREINQRRRERFRRQKTRAKAAAARENAERTKAADYRFNEGYLNQVGNLEERNRMAQSGFDDQERQLGINYGMGQFGGDAASNPYSRAAMLQQSYNRSQRASLNQMAGAGQLYSGAMSNARAANMGQYGQQTDALQKDFDARTNQIGAGRAQSSMNLAFGKQSAEIRARQEAKRLFPLDRNNAPILQKPKLPPRPKMARPRFRRNLPPKKF